MPRSPPQTPPISSAILSRDPWTGSSTTRLQALYSDFSRQKQSNPVSFQANIEWWKKALQTIVATGLQEDGPSAAGLILHANASLMNLVKVAKVGKPLALGTVLAELHSTNTFIPINDFMALNSSLYATRSLPIRVVSYVVGKPLWWALEQAGIVGDEGILGSGSRDRHKGTSWYGDYVLVSLLEAAGDATIELQESRSGSPADALYSWASFSNTFSSLVKPNQDQLHKDDLKVLLKYLERDRGVVVYDKEVIKFVDPSTSVNSRTITNVDRGVLELKNAVASMHSQVESLQQKIDQCTKAASTALQQGSKPVALARIRIRKQYQELLSKRLNSLSTLESTLLSVEAAMGDVEIMKSYELSTTTLRSILSHPSLERNNIDKTMEALSEAHIDAKEIDDAVRVAGEVAVGTSEGIDDAEVEAEWAALVKEMGTSNEVDALERTLDGVKAPTHAPQAQHDGKDLERQAVEA